MFPSFVVKAKKCDDIGHSLNGWKEKISCAFGMYSTFNFLLLLWLWLVMLPPSENNAGLIAHQVNVCSCSLARAFLPWCQWYFDFPLLLDIYKGTKLFLQTHNLGRNNYQGKLTNPRWRETGGGKKCEVMLTICVKVLICFGLHKCPLPLAGLGSFLACHTLSHVLLHACWLYYLWWGLMMQGKHIEPEVRETYSWILIN